MGTRLTLAMLAFLGWEACAIVPDVGKFRGTCHGPSGEYARPDGYSPGEPDPRCLPDEDDDGCAVCEDAHCCGARFGCYDDVACSCADEEFDECLEEVGKDGVSAEEAAPRIAACWAEFSASGKLAKARVDCQREFCAMECSVP